MNSGSGSVCAAIGSATPSRPKHEPTTSTSGCAELIGKVDDARCTLKSVYNKIIFDEAPGPTFVECMSGRRRYRRTSCRDVREFPRPKAKGPFEHEVQRVGIGG